MKEFTPVKKICQHFGIDVHTCSWKHETQPIVATNDTTIFYDKIIPTGRFIEGNAIKPDIVIWDKKERKSLIIDVAVPNDYGINRAEREKKTKYQPLQEDLRATWVLRDIEVIPVVVGSTGLLKKNLQNYLDKIPGKPNIREVQISAIKGTVTVLKRALGHRND